MEEVYILKLEDDKYYIGKSKDPIKRFEEHKNGQGSAWTTKYKPIKVVETINNCDKFDEDKYTKLYMLKYGIDNVRGGSYCQLDLDKKTKLFLQKEIRTATNTCFRCGRDSHFVNNCYAKTHINGYVINDNSDSDSSSYSSSNSNSDSDSDSNIIQHRPCLACGETTHKLETCTLNNNIVCTRCGRSDHWKITCTAQNDINGYKLRSHLIGEIGSLFKSFFKSFF